MDSNLGGICALEPMHTGHGDDISITIGMISNCILEGSFDAPFNPIVQVFSHNCRKIRLHLFSECLILWKQIMLIFIILKLFNCHFICSGLLNIIFKMPFFHNLLAHLWNFVPSLFFLLTTPPQNFWVTSPSPINFGHIHFLDTSSIDSPLQSLEKALGWLKMYEAN